MRKWAALAGCLAVCMSLTACSHSFGGAVEISAAKTTVATGSGKTASGTTTASTAPVTVKTTAKTTVSSAVTGGQTTATSAGSGWNLKLEFHKDFVRLTQLQTEMDDLKSDIDDMEQRLSDLLDDLDYYKRQYLRSGYTFYVRFYNQTVDDYEYLYKRYDEAIDAYNAKVDEYNRLLSVK